MELNVRLAKEKIAEFESREYGFLVSKYADNVEKLDMEDRLRTYTANCAITYSPCCL